jgi:hypothetical protein
MRQTLGPVLKKLAALKKALEVRFILYLIIFDEKLTPFPSRRIRVL